MRKKIKWKRILIPLLLALVLFLTEPATTGAVNKPSFGKHFHSWDYVEGSCNRLYCTHCNMTIYHLTGQHNPRRINCWVSVCEDCNKLIFSKVAAPLELGGSHNYELRDDGYTVCQDCGLVQSEYKPIIERDAYCHECPATGQTRTYSCGFLRCSDCGQIIVDDFAGFWNLVSAALAPVMVVLLCVSAAMFVGMLPISMTAVLLYMLCTFLRNRFRKKSVFLRRKE